MVTRRAFQLENRRYAPAKCWGHDLLLVGCYPRFTPPSPSPNNILLGFLSLTSRMTSTARAPIKKSAIGAEALTRPPKDLLQYNKRYQIVICTACQYAIQPAAIARHLKETHAIHRHHRRPYTDYVATLPLSHPSQLIDKGTSARQVVSEDDDFPVPGLPVISGLQCLSPDCGHLCASVKRMQNHWLVDHQTSGFAALDWQSVPLQTFFRGNLLRYFTHPALAVMRPSDESTVGVTL